ncbi:MAG: ribosome-associated translation inhibitor RaiA [Lentisphaerae bacterium]|nr:ribosome-associated translation inhibitor RaiA [Lentisphaerota bacterium]
MNIKITSRRMAITEAIKEHVHTKLAGVLEGFPKVEHAHVVLDVQKFRHIVEVSVQAKNHLRLEARAVSDNLYKSMNQVVDKINRQLRRSRDKRVSHKGSRRRVKLVELEQKPARASAKAARTQPAAPANQH